MIAADVKRLYQSRNWRDRTQPFLLKKNPLCQFVDSDGRQCGQPSTIGHHLVDPKDNPELFFAFSNLVGVCANHHAGGQRGETQGYRFCHTIGALDAVYPHGVCYPEWHKLYVPGKVLKDDSAGPVVPTGEFGRQFQSSALGENKLDAALEEPI